MTTEVPEWEENVYAEDDVENDAPLDDSDAPVLDDDAEPDVDIAELQAEADVAEPGEFEGTAGAPE